MSDDLVAECRAAGISSALVAMLEGGTVDPCLEVDEWAQRESKREKRKRADVAARVIPHEMADLDWEKLPQQALRIAPDVEAWNPESGGLGICGPSRLGKTRLLCWRIQNLIFDSTFSGSVEMISAARFNVLVTDQFRMEPSIAGPAKETLERARKCSVLVLDDLGKQGRSDRVTTELFDLINERTQRGKPILWTANGSRQWLIDKLGPDKGPAIAGRLVDYSERILEV